MSKRRPIVRLVVIVVAVLLLVVRYGLKLRPPNGQAAPSGPGSFSGAIQADEVRLSAEYGGRLAEVTVQEGEPVRRGQVLVRLDPTLIDDQVAIAEAQLAVAQASLARLQAGARPGAIAVARAQEAQAEATVDAARQALVDAQALLGEPQELALQVEVARARLAAAEARVRQATSLRDVAQMGVDALDYMQRVIEEWPYPIKPPSLPSKLQEAPYDLWQAWGGLNAAAAARDGAREQLAQLEAQLAAPQALIGQVDAAAAALARAEAGLEVARAQTAALAAGPAVEQVAAAEARVAQAAAALEALRLQRARLEIAAPLDGRVLVRQVEPGETVAPGTPLLTLADLAQVVLTLYVPEQDLGRVRLGQAVAVTVDSYPGRTFGGQVVYIAGQAEFTPRNVATKDERLDTLYAVRVRLPNPDGALKPGMPADGTFEDW